MIAPPESLFPEYVREVMAPLGDHPGDVNRTDTPQDQPADGFGGHDTQLQEGIDEKRENDAPQAPEAR